MIQKVEFTPEELQPIGPEKIASMIPHAPPHTVPVLKGILRGLCWVPLIRGLECVIPVGLKPMLAYVGDDLETAEGPGAFDINALALIFCKTKALVVNAADCNPFFYEQAVAAAFKFGRAVIIDTQPEHERAWIECALKYSPKIQVLLASPSLKGIAPAAPPFEPYNPSKH
jgi:hypothetical protein